MANPFKRPEVPPHKEFKIQQSVSLSSFLKLNPIQDDYIIHQGIVLGRGASGSVLKCVDRTTRVECALKILHIREESKREITLLMQCNDHPNIVKAIAVYENILSQGQKYYLLVMELLSGGELFDRLAVKVSFTEKEASAIMREIVAAVKYLHDHRIAHRDLKPENLLYSNKSDGAILKLADFGFAKVDNGDLQTPLYTPYYAAPQILKAKEVKFQVTQGALPDWTVYTYDKSCDLWSLGVILYMLLCGYPPFQSEKRDSKLSALMQNAIASGSYVFHDSYWSHISEDAKELVRGLLCTEPAARMDINRLAEDPWITGVKALPVPLSTPDAFFTL